MRAMYGGTPLTQIVDGTELYIVDLKTVPLPNTWGFGREQDYAAALNQAIITGVIREPGKYGIHLSTDGTGRWNVYRIIEEE